MGQMRIGQLVDWDDANMQRLRDLWAEGHSTPKIARHMGASKNAIVGKARRLGLTTRPSPIKRAGEVVKIERTNFLPPLPDRAAVIPAPEPPKPAQPDPVPVLAVVMPTFEPPPLPPRPVPAPEPRVEVPPSAETLFRKSTPCCWPIGNPKTPGFRMCDDTAEPGKPYCPEHAGRAYIRVLSRREDAA
jgi:GcrA cell cycle regulator